jgi:pilus assembly protein CpaC
MNNKTALLLLILNIQPSLAFAYFKEDSLVLSATQVETIKLTEPRNSNIWISNSAILKVKIFGKNLVLQPQKIGITKLRIENKNYNVVVTTDDLKKQFVKLERALSLVQGLKFEIENQEIHIKGQLRNISDWITLGNLGIENWKMEADTSSSQLKLLEIHLNQKLLEDSIARVKIRKDNGYFVYVSQDEINIKSPMIPILRNFGIQTKIDSRSIGLDPMIRVRVTLAEVRKSQLLSYGIKWPEQYSAKILGNGSTGDGQFSPDLFARALETSGDGRILATPVLITRSGQSAEFLAGGEFPLKVFNRQLKDIVWKKYGILLKINPKSDSDGHIRMDLESEISSIDKSKEIDGIPGLLTNRVQSHIDLEKSQTVMLSGLIKRLEGNNDSGIPFLKNLPLIGSLFSSKDFQTDKTEFIVLVTPEIIREH